MDAGPGVSRTFAVMAQPAARTTRRLDWVWGGGLLILGAVLPFAARPVGGITATIIGVAGSVAFAAAMLLFAFGRHSVVARRPLGVAALVALAVLAVASYAWAFAPYEDAAAFEWIVAGTNVQVVLELAASIVAVVQVARAGAVPHAVRWVPLIALLVLVLPQVLISVLAVATPSLLNAELAQPLLSIVSLCGFAAPVGLGIVAIVVGLQPLRRAEASVPVFPAA